MCGDDKNCQSTPVYVAPEAQQYRVVKTPSSVYKKDAIWPKEEATDTISPDRSFKFKEVQSQRRFVEPKKMQPVMWQEENWVQDVTITTKAKYKHRKEINVEKGH